MSVLGLTIPPLDNTLGAVFLGGSIAAMCDVSYRLAHSMSDSSLTYIDLVQSLWYHLCADVLVLLAM